MLGVVRPCRTHLGEELHARWQAHLCGLCLTLRDEAGQPERALTGYDVLLLSVLVEAQAGRLETAQAGPARCGPSARPPWSRPRRPPRTSPPPVRC